MVNKTEKYDYKCDIFSAGVIFHILLTGESLFVGKGHHELLRLNKVCEINQSHSRYNRLEKDQKDLLFKMVEVDPHVRLTADQCLHSAYFISEAIKDDG